MFRLITICILIAATSRLTATVVENFDGYSYGSTSDAFATTSGGTSNSNDGPWKKWNGTAVLQSTSLVNINSDNDVDFYLRCGYTGGDRGAYRDLVDINSNYKIEENTKGSFEFSFRVLSHSNDNINNDLYYGIGYESSPTDGKNSFVAGINLVHDETSGELKLHAFNGGDMSTPSGTYDYGEWYHVALSIDHGANTYSVYVREDGNPYGDAILTDIDFNSNGAAKDIGDGSLSTFMVLADDISANSFAHLDNVGHSANLIPEVNNFSLLIGLGLLTACITNRKLSVRP